MSERKKEASPVEIAALLMDAVCTPAENEQAALEELAQHLGVDFALMQVELMYLRAFSVDFATLIALGESPERTAILEHYYHHWERIASQADEQVLEDLQARLAYYAEVVSQPDPKAPTDEGLLSQIGQAFTQCCQADEQGRDLALLGGAMFSALFNEINDLYEEVDIVALDPDSTDGFGPLVN